jgi:hypothetical protein
MFTLSLGAFAILLSVEPGGPGAVITVDVDEGPSLGGFLAGVAPAVAEGCFCCGAFEPFGLATGVATALPSASLIGCGLAVCF